MSNRIFSRADVLLPKEGFEKWSVIACDQHTSEPEYWAEVEEKVGNAPSTLRMMLPEHLYKSGRLRELVERVRRDTREIADSGILECFPDSYVYVERTLKNGKTRRGIVGKLDLESYSGDAVSTVPVRATEGRVNSKMPVRISLRRGSPLECPHVMLLVDDPSHIVIEPLTGKKESMRKLYDFELMEDGGHIAGWQVTGEAAEAVDRAIDALSDRCSFEARYGVGADCPVMLFAAGDGNHSLATAKYCWEEIKKKLPESEREDHPARYALVELVNIMDSALDFYPIHRVITGVEPEKVKAALTAFFPGAHAGFGEGHTIYCAVGGKTEPLTIPASAATLAIGAFTQFLDAELAGLGGEVDFVHGDDVAIKLSENPLTTSFLFSAVDKSSFFKSIVLEGVLPKKTFSMGEARDKRYYLECRTIER